MIAGAVEMEKALAVKGEENPAVQYAAMRNLLYSELGKKIEILVAYNPKFQYLGEWWKQLYGESEGKDLKGIFPAPSTSPQTSTRWDSSSRTVTETCSRPL